MKYQGKSMMSLNEMVGLAIDYEGDGYVTGYPIVSGNDAYILNGVIEANEEYITINQWVPVFPESIEAVSPSLTDDQQEVLEWLQIYADKDSGDKPFQTIFFLWDCIKSNILGNVELSALRKLTRAEQFQVLAAFAEWGLSNA